MTNVMHKFLIYYLFTSALHVSGFLLVHLQRQVYNFGSGLSFLGFGVSAWALTPYPGDGEKHNLARNLLQTHSATERAVCECSYIVLMRQKNIL
jgi:hypothetical protein